MKTTDRKEWLKAQSAFLEKEKEFTQQRDELAKERRNLPWLLVDKNYTFEGVDGKVTLADLFGNKSQLIVQHFMFGPEWQEGCPGCSFMADSIDGPLTHLEQRDVHFVAVSRAPVAALEAFKKRMGWSFPWYSSKQSDFNFDFNVSFSATDKAAGKIFYNYRTEPYQGEELPGISVFIKDADGKIYHTYSSFGRGAEGVLSVYSLLDMLPKGRDEEPFKDHPMEWVRLHDQYESAKQHACCK